jgi:hypothetical protein
MKVADVKSFRVTLRSEMRPQYQSSEEVALINHVVTLLSHSATSLVLQLRRQVSVSAVKGALELVVRVFAISIYPEYPEISHCPPDSPARFRD